MSELSKAINIWIMIGDNIDILNKKVKELKNKKSLLENKILTIIQTKKLEETPLRLNEKTIMYHSSQSPAPLSQKLLNEVLHESFTDERIITSIHQRIKRKRELMAKTSISLKVKK